MSKYQTEQRKKLISLFESNPHQSYSVQDIHAFLGEDDISISAIYRNISEMLKQGILIKIRDKNCSGTLYQYVNSVHCEGIIHFKCESCDNTFHLSKSISQMLVNLAEEDYSFILNSSSTFLYGECANCSQKRNNI